MLCFIYKSPKREQTYLYVEQQNNFSRVPAELLENFGQPQFTMRLRLDQRERLAAADIQQVITALEKNGFYLQMPPPIENLLSVHLPSTINHLKD